MQIAGKYNVRFMMLELWYWDYVITRTSKVAYVCDDQHYVGLLCNYSILILFTP